MESFNKIVINKQTEKLLKEVDDKKEIVYQDFLNLPGSTPERFQKFIADAGLANDVLSMKVFDSLSTEKKPKPPLKEARSKHADLSLNEVVSLHIPYLTMVRKHGGVIGAAQAQGISTRTIKHHLKKLQEIMGAPVIISGKQFQKGRITELGEELLKLYDKEIFDPKHTVDFLKKFQLPLKKDTEKTRSKNN